MQRQRLTILSVVITLVLMFGVIALTRLAAATIEDTALERFQTSQLQLVTSLSQQTQVTLTSLEGDLSSLASREDIRAVSVTRQADAREALAAASLEYPPGALVSITRFDFRGRPCMPILKPCMRSSQPWKTQQTIATPSQQSWSPLTSQGQRVTADIPAILTRSEMLPPSQVLLVVPVDSTSLNTEFLVAQVDLNALFADLFSFLDLAETGQVWVVNGTGTLQYSSLPEPNLQAAFQEAPLTSLTQLAEPINRSYSVDDVVREAAIAPANVLNEAFIIFLSSDQSEALEDEVSTTLLLLNVFGVFSALCVLVLGSTFSYRLLEEGRTLRLEEQRRLAMRSLLETSRVLNSSLDVGTVLQRILDELALLVPHDSATILLVEDQELRSAAYRSANGNHSLEQPTLQIDEARAAREVIARGVTVVINDTTIDERWSHLAGSAEEIGSWVGVPLRVREQLVGVLGINSHQKHRFSGEDIELAETFADQASIALQNARVYELEVNRIEQELVIARGIQTSLLPPSAPDLPQLEIVSTSLPARQVSGDYYQYITLPDGKLVIAIGDVQGKGIPAALLMAVITTAMRDESTRHTHPSELLQALNVRLIDRMRQNDMNSALILAIYDPQESMLDIANAGMVQPYLRLAGTRLFDTVPIGGYPLGVSTSMLYSARSIKLLPGSLMVMFSDGVVEAQNNLGEMYSFDRIESLLNALPENVTAAEVLATIQRSVEEHLGELDPQDDTTILVLRALHYQPAPPSEPNLEVEGAAGIDSAMTEAPTEEPEDEVELSRKKFAPIVYGDPGMPRRNVELFCPASLALKWWRGAQWTLLPVKSVFRRTYRRHQDGCGRSLHERHRTRQRRRYFALGERSAERCAKWAGNPHLG
ncbi:MAG: SpoIIE family protein phosphatase [Anaerolineae bacterium]|nr:SpoIIE family protein phosphatase [Anaerolineae bacterium]